MTHVHHVHGLRIRLLRRCRPLLASRASAVLDSSESNAGIPRSHRPSEWLRLQRDRRHKKSITTLSSHSDHQHKKRPKRRNNRAEKSATQLLRSVFTWTYRLCSSPRAFCPPSITLVDVTCAGCSYVNMPYLLPSAHS